MIKKKKKEQQHKNAALRVGGVGESALPKYVTDKREILLSLKMAHENLVNRKYKNARVGIGIMISTLERELE